MTRVRSPWLVAAVVLVVGALVALVWQPWDPEASNGTDGYLVDGPVVAAAQEGDGGLGALISGQLQVVEGCLRLGGNPVVWPTGTSWNDDEQAVVLRDGTLVRAGDTVEGGGGFFGGPEDADFFEDGDAAQALGTCRVEGQEVAFFNSSESVEVT